MSEDKKYSYDQLTKNKTIRIDKNKSNRKMKKEMEKQNTCDCNRNVFRWQRIKPHKNKELCIADLTRRINYAYSRGNDYLEMFEEQTKNPHFSANTIETVLKEFKNNGLNDIWWTRGYVFGRTLIIFKDYSIFHKSCWYTCGFSSIFDC